MSTLSWGKPTIQIGAYVGTTAPSSFTDLPASKEDSTKLATAKGAKVEAKAEGGEIVDIRYAKNSYTLETEIFVKNNEDKPIEDVDGIVAANYAVRLIPEDSTLEGFIIEKASVQVEETWTSKDGKMLKYTFDALKPAAGVMLKPYTKTV